ncbi:MAG TPA: hypothetical protein VFP92_10685 [Rhodanobacteraceae bacterium]|nr:hypothetical protein [Rhodanobacteraceae bacterium]
MNTAVHVPGLGLLDFGPNEARKAAAFLAVRLRHVEEADQPAYSRAIRDLEHAAKPEAHFDTDAYTMPGCVPGWQADV